RDAGRIALLKMDVEGHELKVFQGATEILANHAPILLFECEARHLAHHTMQDVFAFLQGFGYRGRFFTPDGLRPLEEFDPAIHQNPGRPRFWDRPEHCHNFLFLPRSKQA
ncbi:MAG: hypothetical protein QOF19_1437, partial [Alphaproteobacteria bacterium]|nr:hypothetical protein [Alphaproteobacteria bacterium]